MTQSQIHKNNTEIPWIQENTPSTSFCQSLIGAVSKCLDTGITATIWTQLAQTLLNIFVHICQE